MANIFSGLFKPQSQQGNAFRLAKYKQELEDYEDARKAYEQQTAIEAMSPQLQEIFSKWSGERAGMGQLSKTMMGNTATFDQGNLLLNKLSGQRGSTLEDIASNAEKLKRYKAERDYMLSTPDPLDVPAEIQVQKYFESLGDDTNNFTQEQINFLIRKRKEQMLDTEAGFQSNIRNKYVPKEHEKAAFQKAWGEENSQQYIAFPDTLMTTDNFVRNTDHKRGAVQKLFGITDKGTTGWNKLFNMIPGSDQLAWDNLKLEVIANIGIDKLIEMKESSAQGASGLGALSDTELEILTALMGSLDQAQRPAEIKRVLIRLDEQYSLMMKNRKIRLRDMDRRNRRMEKRKGNVPEAYRYVVHPDQEYLLDPKGEAKGPTLESPLKETPEEARERILKERKSRKAGG